MNERSGILAIEDDSEDFQFLERIISKEADFHLRRSSTLAEGMAELAENEPALVLLDLTLPDSRGIDVIPKLSAKSYVPVVVLSGRDDKELAYNAVQLGAQDYLVKGTFDSVMLIKTIRYAIERYRLVHELSESRRAIQREQEQRRVEISIPSPIPTVTANSYGQYSLREGKPDKFNHFVTQYRILLEGSVQQRAFKVDNDIPSKLRALATLLGKQRVVPRDVVELHTVTLEDMTRNTSPGKSEAYNEEGRYLLIGLLGHLCSFYRGYCHSLLPAPHTGMGELLVENTVKSGT